jgi:O-acetylserine/cysteine efflux transporter
MTERERASAAGFAADDLVAIVLINLMWGLNIVAVKLSVDLIAPFTAAFLRQAMVFVLCLPWLRIVPGRMRILLTLGAIAGATFFIPLNLALAEVENTGTVAIAGQLGAPFALILSILFLGDRIGIPRLAGILMTFLGVMLIAFDPAAADEPLGLVLTAISAVFWAISSLLQRKLAGVPVLVLYAWIGLCGSAILAPIAMLYEPHAMRDLTHIPPVALGAVLFSAVCSTLIGQGGMAWLLQRHPISAVIPYTLVAPVVSVIAASAFFGTPITGMMILGGIVVLAGVAIVTIRTARKSELPEEAA